MTASASRFIDRLTLEPVDRDIFSGTCHSGAPLRAYGGQIAAQALMAAGMTVDDKARRVHSSTATSCALGARKTRSSTW